MSTANAPHLFLMQCGDIYLLLGGLSSVIFSMRADIIEYLCIQFIFGGLPWWSSGKESALQCRGRGFDP